MIKKDSKKRWRDLFDSRKVFIIYIFCFALTIATMILSIVVSIVGKLHTIEKAAEHIFLCLLAIALLNIPMIMKAKFRFKIPAFIQITVAIFIVAHCVLGEIYRFYDYIFLFDKALHATAGVVIAVLGFSVVYGISANKSESVKLPPFFVAFFAFCFALTLLILWEVYEYGMDSIFGINMQRWQDGLTEIEVNGIKYLVTSTGQGSGLIDSMSDMIVGIIGAGFICLIGGLSLKKNPVGKKFLITKEKPALEPEVIIDRAESNEAEPPQK